MTLKDGDFQRLLAMQRLCTQVEQDVQTLEQFAQFLQQSELRRAQLQQAYERDWLRLIESDRISVAQRDAVEALVMPGAYSIFMQDVIWDALSDTFERRREIAQQLRALAPDADADSGADTGTA